MKKLFLLTCALICAGSLQAFGRYRDRGDYYEEGDPRGIAGDIAEEVIEDVADVGLGYGPGLYYGGGDYWGGGWDRDGGGGHGGDGGRGGRGGVGHGGGRR